MNFLSEVNKTAIQANNALKAEKADGGLLRYKQKIRKYASQGKTKIFLHQTLPTSVEAAEKAAKALKAEGLKLQRTPHGIYVHWA